LFLSTSPSSPFISLSHPPISETGQLTEPTRKTWFDLNNGYLFDPVIRAFSTNTSSPTTTIIKPSGLPDNYVDMRYRGLGLIFDFGWRRTEAGMEWEVEDWRDTKMRYGLVDVKKGWVRGFLVRLRGWIDGFMGMMWPREGSLVGIW
jgi:hypothetical protein